MSPELISTYLSYGLVWAPPKVLFGQPFEWPAKPEVTMGMQMDRERRHMWGQITWDWLKLYPAGLPEVIAFTGGVAQWEMNLLASSCSLQPSIILDIKPMSGYITIADYKQQWRNKCTSHSAITAVVALTSQRKAVCTAMSRNCFSHASLIRCWMCLWSPDTMHE